MSNTSATNTSAASVGMTMGAVLAWERVFGTDGQPPFPGELTEGFPGKSKAPTAALMVAATAVMAVALGMGKRGGDKMAGFPDGRGAMSGVEGAVHCFLLVFGGA
jgi:hypothetical protein